ncbi:uncharacterized protein LOC117716413 isoform X2 [Arvicanthis niloticus]|uniref:uncharacterized protein LOC117716413 isoform X2 n=1 Tax=Arvicanthis niloticus TaxID=61156 RepID=UPI00402B06C9
MIRVRATGIPAPPLLPPLLMLSLSLLLLLLSPTAQGDCGPPPDIPNATPDLSRHTTFAKNTKVTYSCNKGYKQIPGKSNIVVCLGTGEWSGNETFCNKTCNGPQRVKFATLKQEYISVNFFPIGTTVEYKCRPGFVKVPSVSAKSTCLEELVWSPVGEFCKKKACHNPGELQNGHITILTDILFGAEISFSCDEGYRLVGVTSTFCTLSVGRDTENPTVDWEDAFPECKEIICPGPPDINNGKIQEESDSYKFNQVVTYSCAEGFTLVGNTNIVCIEKSDHGEWSGPPPKCIEKSKITTKKPTVNVPRIPSTTQKSTVDVSSTKIPPTPQKPTTVIVPSTRIPATPAKTTTVLVPGTRVPPKPHKPTKANIPSTAAPPTPQKANTAIVRATELPPTPQKTNTADGSATEIPPTPQKTNTADVPATEIPPTPQKTNTADIPATELPPTPQKTNTADGPATEISLTPQKTNTADVAATEIPPTPQKTNTADDPVTEISLTPQKTNTADVPATELPPTPQKTNTADVPATELPTPQKANTADGPATEIPPTPQKANTAKSSATKPATAEMSLISTTVSTQTPPVTQHLTTVNSSAVQTAQTIQGFATVKPSLTQNLPATQRPTISYFSMTKGFHRVTQRFTSAHLTATQNVPAIKTTVHHPTRTSKDKGESNSGVDRFVYGHTCLITLTVLHAMLLLIG